MSNIPAIRYTSRDFEAIKQSFENHLRARFADSWKDFYQSNIGIALSDLIAYAFDVLSFQIDYTANEMFLDTARDKRSVWLLGRLVGYQMRTATSASVECTGTITAPQANRVIIPAGTTITSRNGVAFYTLSDQYILAGETTADDILFVEGTVETDTFSSDGTAFQRFTLARSSVVQNTLVVEVNGDEWTEYTSLAYCTDTTQGFVVEYDENGQATIMFGDGTVGAIPPAGADNIVVSYRVGGGVRGNIPLNDINGSVTGTIETTAVTIQVRIVNDENTGSGGEDAETANHAKIWIPYWVRSNGRAVTESDYDVLANAFNDPIYGSPAFAKSYLKQEIPELNTVMVACLTGDTKVRLVDGSEKSMEELALSYKKPFYVYAYDKDRKKITIAKAFNSRITKYVDELVEVTLDNGEKLKCTPDHKILMRGGVYKEAGDLVEGDSLMPFNFGVKEKGKNQKYPYLYVKQPSGAKELVHQIVVNDIFGGYKFPNKEVCHHLDFDRFNNDPSNLRLMSIKEHRDYHTKTSSNNLKKLWGKPETREYLTSCSSKQMKELWEKPEFREKMRKVSSKMLKGFWEKPEFREKMRDISKKNGTNTMEKLWKDSCFRENHSKRHRELMKKLREEMKTNEKFLVTQRKASQFALKNLWKTNEEFRRKNAEKLAIMNKSPVHTLNAKNGRYRQIALKALSLGKITEETWEKVRGKSWTFSKAIETFGSIDNLIKELEINHKVVSVKKVKVNPIPVYDLSVEKYHNFALSSGIFVHNCWGRDGYGTIVNPGEGLKSAIEAYFNNDGEGGVKMVCQHCEVVDGEICYVDIDLGVSIASTYTETEMRQAITEAVTELFSSSEMIPGADFRISWLYNKIQSISGIQYCIVRELTLSKKETQLVAVGNAVDTNFTYTMTGLEQGTELIRNSVDVWYDSFNVYSDDGEGILRDSGGVARGTVNYDTLEIDVTFAGAPGIAIPVYVEFRYLLEYSRSETLDTGDGTTRRFRGSIAHPPVNPYSPTSGLKGIAISDGTRFIMDDGAGNLIGDVDGSGVNRIDYTSGAYDFTFLTAPSNGVEIFGAYYQLMTTSSKDLTIDKNQLAVQGNLDITVL